MENSEKRQKIMVFIIIILNSVIGVTDRVLQLVYYCIKIKDYKDSNDWVNFVNSTTLNKTMNYTVLNYTVREEYVGNHTDENYDDVNKVALTFCILPSGIHFVFIIIYLVFHHEELLTPLKKLKIFFMYLFSSESLNPIGMQKSFKTKYSEYSDNPVVLTRVMNALHVMFVSIPQLIIVSVFGTTFRGLDGLGISCLVMSALFILWSVIFYLLCVRFDETFETVIQEHTKTI
jgi:hypothetical protein